MGSACTVLGVMQGTHGVVCYPARACGSRGYVIGAGVHFETPQKSLNGTLAVDSLFQTLAVDFSSNL